MTEKPIINICAYCKKKVRRRDNSGIWDDLSAYSYRELMKGEQFQVSHGICDPCHKIAEKEADDFIRQNK